MGPAGSIASICHGRFKTKGQILLKKSNIYRQMFNLIFFLFIALWAFPAISSVPHGEKKISCHNGFEQFVLYESETSGLIQQDIQLQHSGIFEITAIAEGFSFEGMSYARRTSDEKWTPIETTKPGQKSWTQRWKVIDGDPGSRVRIQMLKDTANCKSCIAWLEVRSRCDE